MKKQWAVRRISNQALLRYLVQIPLRWLNFWVACDVTAACWLVGTKEYYSTCYCTYALVCVLLTHYACVTILTLLKKTYQSICSTQCLRASNHCTPQKKKYRATLKLLIYIDNRQYQPRILLNVLKNLCFRFPQKHPYHKKRKLRKPHRSWHVFEKNGWRPCAL